MHKREDTGMTKKRIYRSSLITVICGFLIAALIVIFLLYLLLPKPEKQLFPDEGIWFCEELNLLLDADEYIATFQTANGAEQCQILLEHNSNYITLKTEGAYRDSFTGVCIKLTDDVLQIRESHTQTVYSFQRVRL